MHCKAWRHVVISRVCIAWGMWWVRPVCIVGCNVACSAALAAHAYWESWVLVTSKRQHSRLYRLGPQHLFASIQPVSNVYVPVLRSGVCVQLRLHCLQTPSCMQCPCVALVYHIFTPHKLCTCTHMALCVFDAVRASSVARLPAPALRLALHTVATLLTCAWATRCGPRI